LAIALVPINWLYPKRIDPLFEVQALFFILFLAAIFHGMNSSQTGVPAPAKPQLLKAGTEY